MQDSSVYGLSVIDLAIVVGRSKKLLVFGPLLAGLLAYGASFFFAPTYTAHTIFMPPQQQQSVAVSALQSIGNVAGLVGAGGVKNPGDQYVALLQSVTVSDRVIDRFNLKGLYKTDSYEEARFKLAQNVRIDIGRKDGLISVDVTDIDPKRAAELANAYVVELRRVTSDLAMTEAQQRRLFFERQLQQTQQRLIAAQRALQEAGINERTLRVEPKAAAEAFAVLRAETTALELKIQSLRGVMTDESPEVKAALRQLGALKGELVKAQRVDKSSGADEYIDRYREYKYQETLFELFARQFELAKLDESREGSVIQVVDPALVPEGPSSPRRYYLSGMVATFSLVLLLLYVLVQAGISTLNANEELVRKLQELKAAWR